MNYCLYYIGIPSIIAPVVFIMATIIKENEKRKRITLFKDFDATKIEAIGNYEKKSKSKYSFHAFWKKKDGR